MGPAFKHETPKERAKQHTNTIASEMIEKKLLAEVPVIPAQSKVAALEITRLRASRPKAGEEEGLGPGLIEDVIA